MYRRNKKVDVLLVGKMSSKDTIEVWCPWCKRNHIHGWEAGKNKQYVEHRQAHCSAESPIYKTGYYIGEV